MANANANVVAIYRLLLLAGCGYTHVQKRKEPRGAMLVHLGAAARFRSNSTFE